MPVVHNSPLLLKGPDEEDDAQNVIVEVRYIDTDSLSSGLYIILLGLSVLLNVYQFGMYYPQILSTPSGSAPESHGLHRNDYGSEPSYIMGLAQNITTPFASRSGIYGDGRYNMTALDEIWESPDFEPNRNFVAIDHDWAAAKGLLPTQPWPWDTSKGIYLVRGMHLLHCTKAIYQSFDRLQHGEPPTWPWIHLEHCAHMLREEIMCSANDNLIYTGRTQGQEDRQVPVPGLDQPRLCRDWSRLVAWATERSACFWNIPATGPEFRESERYKFCPGGKEYW